MRNIIDIDQFEHLIRAVSQCDSSGKKIWDQLTLRNNARNEQPDSELIKAQVEAGPCGPWSMLGGETLGETDSF